MALSLPSINTLGSERHSTYPVHEELAGPSWDTQYSRPQSSDPHHFPLPASSDNDLTHGPTIAHAIGYSPTIKTAGTRRKKCNESAPEAAREKRKGKRKRTDTDDDDSAQSEDSDAPPGPKKHGHGGRRAGAGNYQEQDLKEMLRLVEKELPLGQRGWKRIHQKYAIWATAKGRPIREWNLLESKFKNVCIS